MRFKSYLLEDERVSTFCSLKIKLVDANTEYVSIVCPIKEKYNIQMDICTVLSEANLSLKSIYKGKYKFDLCLNEGITPDDLKKLDSKKLNGIKREWYRVNDKLAKIQKVLEKHLQNIKGE